MIHPQLPLGWVSKALGDCCDIVSGGTPRRECPEFWDGTVPWVTPKDISDIENPIFVDPPERITELGLRKSSATLLPKGAILFSSRAPIGLVAIAGQPMATNQGFKSLVPGPCLDSEFLYYAIKRKVPEIAARGNGATFKEVSKSVMSEIEIAFPTKLDEQRRIAAVLKKVEGIRRKRDQALALAEKFLRSAFLEMFGDPVANPKGLHTRPLAKLATFVSGATPSKSRKDFWLGNFPWVSPKDMKKLVIDGAQDHVSEAVFSETNLKKIPKNTLLIVVRGMILAHTVPIGITSSEVSINQDIKAIVFDKAIDPRFGLWCLKVQHENLLSKIDTAAHGTKRFDMDRLGSVPIVLPDENAQKRFVSLSNKFSACHANLNSATDLEKLLSASLIQCAFLGEL